MTQTQVRSDLSIYSNICGGWATFKNFVMEGVLMLNFVPVFGNVHGVAFIGIKQHFHVSFQSSRFFRSSWRRLQSALEPSACTAYGRLHIGRL